MGLFSKILSKLGIGKDEPAGTTAAVSAKPAVTATAKPIAAKPVAPAAGVSAKPAGIVREGREDSATHYEPKPAVPAVKPISEVDVVKKLEDMASGSGLDWKVSIVDLLKVLGIDSSLNARKELAEELGCPAELMGGDHSKMNIWLHKTVLKKIAENGGNIPANMLD